MKRARRWLAHRRVDGLVTESINHARAHDCVRESKACDHWDALQMHLSDAYDQLAKASR